MKVAIYVRVSTRQQTVDSQLADLQGVAEKAGWEVVGVYRDEAISGGKSVDERPALKRVLDGAIRREFAMLVIWSVDRLARSTVDLLHIMQDLQKLRIELYAHKQAIDTTTASGRMMWQLLGVFAEFEREMIRDRVRAGLDNARARGVKLGRPRLSVSQEEDILRLRASGMGLLKIGRTLGVGTSQVQRVCSSGGSCS